jgi:hypothetical protein
MAIQVDASQTFSVHGTPFQDLYVTLFAIQRLPDGISPWTGIIKFFPAVRADDGSYAVTGKERVVTMSNVEVLATQLAMQGKMNMATGVVAIQPAMADIIASQCPDLSTARYIQVP